MRVIVLSVAPRLLMIATAAVALVLGLAVAIWTPKAQAQEPSGHAGHSMAGMSMEGMSMSGMTPPSARPEPAGPVVRIVAGSDIPPAPVQGTPGVIALAFDQPAQVEWVTLTNGVGQQIPTHLTLPVEPVAELRLPVVNPLAPGSYELRWVIGTPARTEGAAMFKIQSPDGAEPSAPMHHHHGG